MAEHEMPCPECAEEGVEGSIKIGNRRGSCRTCNLFASRTRRAAIKRLMSRRASEYAQFHAAVEVELYAALIEDRLTGQREDA